VVTGDIARHGAAMLLASKKFELESQLTSDCEPLCWLIDVLKPFEGYLKWMRDQLAAAWVPFFMSSAASFPWA